MAATSGATRTTRSGGSVDSAASTTAASPRIPSVCDTLTARPRPTAWRGVPRVPTRYAAIRVLPCPGVTAWPAPRTPAVRSAISAISGVAGALRSTSGIELSPLGTVVVDDTTDEATDDATGTEPGAAAVDGTPTGA